MKFGWSNPVKSDTDPVLKNEACVLRNFQGTTFELSSGGFKRILEIAFGNVPIEFELGS